MKPQAGIHPTMLNSVIFRGCHIVMGCFRRRLPLDSEFAMNRVTGADRPTSVSNRGASRTVGAAGRLAPGQRSHQVADDSAPLRASDFDDLHVAD